MHHRGTQRGQAVLELAIVAPVLILLLLAIFQLAFIFAAQIGVINAARDVARAASGVEIATAANATAASQSFYTRMTDSAGSLVRTVSMYRPSSLVTSGSATDLSNVRRTRVCYYSFTDVSTTPAVMAYVEVQYAHPLFLPLVGDLIDAFDGNGGDGALRLGAIEEIRVGNPPLQSTDITGIANPLCNT